MRTAEAVRAPKNPSRAYALCGVFLRHFLARHNASHCFMVGPKGHIQPERYECGTSLCCNEKILKKFDFYS
jgi:hypothetical protein